jgi:hypothetical protein
LNWKSNHPTIKPSFCILCDTGLAVLAWCLILLTQTCLIMKKMLRFFLCAIALTTAATLSAQTLKGVDDSQNAGKVEWVTRQANAGTIAFGVPFTHEFKVKNISSENLHILQVRSTCHCTSVEWAQEPIRPGGTGIIKATYDSQREGDFFKVIMVSTNFDPAQTVPLAISGKVDKKLEADAKQ